MEESQRRNPVDRRFVAEGSFTIEASLLMPFLLMVVIAILYLGFYLHDQCVVRAEMERYLVQLTTKSDKESITGSDLEDGEEKLVLKRLNESLEEKMFLTKKVESEFDGQSSTVTLTVCCELQIPFVLVKKLLGTQTIEMTKERGMHDPVSSVRIGQVIVHSLQNTTAYETIRSYIEKEKSFFE